MVDETKSTVATAKNFPSLLESFVEIRFLLLLLCFVFYLDIWLFEYNVDPTNLSVTSAYKVLLSTPIFTILLFLGSYSLLMIGVFPVLRILIATARLYIRSSITISNSSKEDKQLSNWSAAFICLTIYSGFIGYSSKSDSYKGLSNYIFNILESSSFSELFLKFSTILFWFYCFYLASKVDDYDFI